MRLLRLAPVLLVAALPAQSNAADRVHIAVVGLFHPRQLVVEATPAHPLLLTAEGREFVIGTGARQRVVMTCSAGTVDVRVEGRRFAAPHLRFAARPGGDSEFELVVPGRFRRAYYGQLEISASESELLPVVEMELETAVASIVAAEAAADTPMEALKAQAVVSRSYLVAGGPRHVNADFCDTTHCQFLRQAPPPESAAARATTATRGLVLAWQDKAFAAMYSASCGGRTRTLAQAGYQVQRYPYFAVDCPYCLRSPERWSTALSAEDAASLHPDSENDRVKAGRKLGWEKVPSNHYETKVDAAGNVAISGQGRGHGIGLCQFGAAGMARDGRDFRAILEHYFPNTTLKSAR